MNRRNRLIAAVGTFVLGAATLAGPAAHGQPAGSYPDRAVRVIIPFAPGGTVDIVGRLTGQLLSEQLGQQFVVENITGAGGTIGAAQAAKAAPDGYTLVAGTPGSIAITPQLMARPPYDPMVSFQPISLVVDQPLPVIVNAASPIGSIADLIAAAKAKPGGLSYGSAGAGSVSHLSGELFKHMAGVDIVHVPYRGTAPAAADLAGGRIDVIFTGDISSIGAEIKAIGIGTKARVSFLADVPTVSESGLPGYEASSWFGLFAPAGTSPEIIGRLNGAVRNGLQAPGVAERLAKIGVVPVGSSPDEFRQFLTAKLAEVRDIIKAANIKVE